MRFLVLPGSDVEIVVNRAPGTRAGRGCWSPEILSETWIHISDSHSEVFAGNRRAGFLVFRREDDGSLHASLRSMDLRRFVYILLSDTDPEHHYVGLTSDVAERLRSHNTGPSGVTRHHRPWSLLVSLEFADAGAAARFECYLKTGSGRAFAKRHF